MVRSNSLKKSFVIFCAPPFVFFCVKIKHSVPLTAYQKKMGEKITIYHNNMCSKSREAMCLLEQEGAEIEVVEYLKNVPKKKDLKYLLKKLGIKAHDLMRKGEQEYTDHVKGKTLTETEMVGLLVKYPKLIERPIIVKGNKAIIGRPPSLVVDFVG